MDCNAHRHDDKFVYFKEVKERRLKEEYEAERRKDESGGKEE